MNQNSNFLKRHSLVIGIILIFLFTWPIDLANSSMLPIKVPLAIAVSLGWGISIAAVIMTGLTLGKVGVITLLKRFLIWRVEWKCYLVAFLFYPVIFMSAVLIDAVWTQTSIDFSKVVAHNIFGPSASLPVFILPFFIFDFLTNGEEMGWRGYVLPRLQAKQTALISSLVVGLLWGLWHLPRYFAPDNTGSFGLLLIKVLADTVIYTWLYNNTKGSLLLTTILHAAGNTAGAFLPMANTLSGEHMDVYIIAIVLLILTAIMVTIVSVPSRLSRTELKQVQE